MEDAFANVKEYFGDRLTYYIVAQEEHKKTLGLHLHILLKFTRRFTTTKTDYFDIIVDGGKHHCNIVGVKNPTQAVRYVVKDSKYLAEGIDVDAVITSGKGSRDATATQITAMFKTGASVHQVLEKYPGFATQHFGKLQSMRNLLVRAASFDAMLEWRGAKVADGYDDPLHQDLVAWLNDNIKNDKRPPRKRQLWLVAQPGKGKTRLTNWLARFCRTWHMPRTTSGSSWFDGYEDGETELCVFDEFTANQMRATDLNTFVDGGGVGKQFATKGSFTFKFRNPPCIVLSNRTIDTCYRGVGDVVTALTDAVRARFLQLDFADAEILVDLGYTLAELDL